MMAWLALVLAATPLEVRVLEKEHATRATVEAPVSCASAPDAGPGRHVLEVRRGELQVDGAPCPVASVAGPVTVTLEALTRTFPGALRVTAEGSFLKLVAAMDLEAYLPSVVAAELDDAPPAAMQAQAVVSRTFAQAGRRRHEGYDVCDLAHCQVYRGEEGVTAAARAAVQATAGQVLLVGGVALEPTFFHAACGGHTSRPGEVFKQASQAPGVTDVVRGQPACAAAPDLAWTFTIDRAALAEALGRRDEGPAVEVLRRDEAGRVLELRTFGLRLSGTDFVSKVGRAFGWQTLRSARFTVAEADQHLRFTGQGLGHGVGLCQWGAKGLAAQGASASDILKRYFPQSRVRVPEGLVR